jgi:hypothetical protein
VSNLIALHGSNVSLCQKINCMSNSHVITRYILVDMSVNCKSVIRFKYVEIAWEILVLDIVQHKYLIVFGEASIPLSGTHYVTYH